MQQVPSQRTIQGLIMTGRLGHVSTPMSDHTIHTKQTNAKTNKQTNNIRMQQNKTGKEIMFGLELWSLKVFLVIGKGKQKRTSLVEISGHPILRTKY